MKKKKLSIWQDVYLIGLTVLAVFDLISCTGGIHNFIFYRMKAVGFGWLVPTGILAFLLFIMISEIFLDKAKAVKVTNIILLTVFLLMVCFSIGFHFKS